MKDIYLADGEIIGAAAFAVEIDNILERIGQAAEEILVGRAGSLIVNAAAIKGDLDRAIGMGEGLKTATEALFRAAKGGTSVRTDQRQAFLTGLQHTITATAPPAEAQVQVPTREAVSEIRPAPVMTPPAIIVASRRKAISPDPIVDQPEVLIASELRAPEARPEPGIHHLKFKGGVARAIKVDMGIVILAGSDIDTPQNLGLTASQQVLRDAMMLKTHQATDGSVTLTEDFIVPSFPTAASIVMGVVRGCSSWEDDLGNQLKPSHGLSEDDNDRLWKWLSARFSEPRIAGRRKYTASGAHIICPAPTTVCTTRNPDCSRFKLAEGQLAWLEQSAEGIIGLVLDRGVVEVPAAMVRELNPHMADKMTISIDPGGDEHYARVCFGKGGAKRMQITPVD